MKELDTEIVERCPICGGDGKIYKWSSDVLASITVDKCEDCGTIYQNPRLTREAMEEYYRSGLYRNNYPGDAKREMGRADRLILLIDRFKIRPKRCLDIGCDKGYLLRQLQIYYFAQIVGLELNPEVSDIEEVVHSKEDVTGKFDLITCIHTLEHFYDPLKELKWMVDRLNPGGTILIEVPLAEKITLPHPIIFTMKSLRLMLDSLGLDYLIVDYQEGGNNLCHVFIGERYRNIKVERVVYSFDSPDFKSQSEYNRWVMESYGK